MTEPAPAPFDPFVHGRQHKLQHQQALGEALTGGRQSEQPALDDLAERIATAVAPVVEAAIDAALVAVSTEATTEPNPEVRPSPSFDGGARQTPPQPPPSHDEWLVAVIRQRLADRGAAF